MKKYLMIMSVLSLGLLGVFYGLNEVWFDSYLHSHFATLIVFFLLQSIPIGWVMDQAIKEPSSFVIYVVGAIGLRMITGLFFVLILFFLNIPHINQLAIQFVGVYLLYLGFELSIVLTNLRRN